jgi:anti-sigma B factor antagonist
MVSELLQVETTATGTETVMAIAGEFDFTSAEWFGACVGTVLEKRPGLMAIDAHALTFVDSSGLRSLLLARDAAIQAGVSFHVREASPMLRSLAERTGLGRLLLDD